jgi:uncharacterized integral membrane protein
MKRGLFSITAIGVLVVLFIIALENPQPVVLHLLGWRWVTPLFVPFLVGFVSGGVLMFLFLLPARIRLSWRLRRLRRAEPLPGGGIPGNQPIPNPLVRTPDRTRETQGS